MVEADESDRSFLKLGARGGAWSPTSSSTTTPPTARSASSRRPSRSSRGRRALRVLGPGVELPGEGEQRAPSGSRGGDLRAERVELLPLGSRFSVEGVEVELRVPGRHNVLNALAALAACRAAGLEPAEAGPALAGFTGAGRRFEDARRRRPSGARVFDDYAHHPTEVRATLEAARTLEPRRVWWPASSRTSTRARARLAREFGKALALADVVVVLDDLPRARARRGLPGRQRALVAGAAADAARRPAGVVAAAARTTPSAMLREELRRGRRAAHAGRRRRGRRWPGGSTAGVSPPGRQSSAGLPARAPDHGPHRRRRPTSSPARTPPSGWPSCWPGRTPRASR